MSTLCKSFAVLLLRAMEPYVLPAGIEIGKNPQRFHVDVKGKGKETSLSDEVYYRMFRSEEEDLPAMMELIDQELSEP